METMIRNLILAIVVALAPLSLACAADLNGVAMPDTRMADGTQMQLNGIGLRTYSVLRIPIYVAGLYLERRSDNPDAIIHSTETKLLDIRFLRDVDAEAARKAWLDGFEGNCKKPCSLDPRDVQRFLAAVPAVHNGDETTLLFTQSGVGVRLNGQSVGAITDPHFAEIMLATFIGVEPPTPRLKRQLLGNRD
jgi:Chalcone isomerase-like